MSWIGTAARFAYELGSELWREHRREQAKARAAKTWAETPAGVRACPRCRESAYTPGRSTCTKCGSALS